MSASLAEAQSHSLAPDAYLAHVQAIAEAKRAHDEAGMALARVKKAAKESSVDLQAHKWIEKLRKMEVDEQIILLRHFSEYGAYLDMTAFKQLSLFDAADGPAVPPDAVTDHTAWEAGEAGLKSGRNGSEARENPYEAGTAHHVAWLRSFHVGRNEREIASEMADGDKGGGPVADNAPATRRGRGQGRKAGNGARRDDAEAQPLH